MCQFVNHQFFERAEGLGADVADGGTALGVGVGVSVRFVVRAIDAPGPDVDARQWDLESHATSLPTVSATSVQNPAVEFLAAVLAALLTGRGVEHTVAERTLALACLEFALGFHLTISP